eukprot:UN06234
MKKLGILPPKSKLEHLLQCTLDIIEASQIFVHKLDSVNYDLLSVWACRETSDMLKLYSTYCNRYNNIRKQVKKVIEGDAAKKFLKGKKSLEMHLLQPVQRPPRYLLLLRQIRKKTSKEHPQWTTLNVSCKP